MRISGSLIHRTLRRPSLKRGITTKRSLKSMTFGYFTASCSPLWCLDQSWPDAFTTQFFQLGKISHEGARAGAPDPRLRARRRVTSFLAMG
jgi:hypothetical protein